MIEKWTSINIKGFNHIYEKSSLNRLRNGRTGKIILGHSKKGKTYFTLSNGIIRKSVQYKILFPTSLYQPKNTSNEIDIFIDFIKSLNKV